MVEGGVNRGILTLSPGKVCCVLFLCCLALCSLRGAEGYKNYTVGDDLGWYDKLENPKVDYQKWVAGKNFSLGDFLIFNTDKNHSVVQTHKLTTYKRCRAQDDDTILWTAGAPTVSQDPVTVAVPLVREGMNYFFSGYYDGEQCKHGQRFKANVTHGQGLPESLRTPPEAPAPASGRGDDDDSVPDTVVPSNFNNPKGTVAAEDGSSGAVGAMGRGEGGVALGFALVLWGLVTLVGVLL